MPEKKLPFWKRKEVVVGLLFVIVVPVVAHIMLSKYGFNPTDDGFILAGSERILDGQVPHKDFISIRTTGSLYLHAPFVALGGDYTIWLSRLFVWFELAAMAWMWTLFVSRQFKVMSSVALKAFFALTTMAFTAHVFPIMAWHSIDALFVSSIGFALCTSGNPKVKMLGYLVLGSSILFRQNFVILVLVGIIMLIGIVKKNAIMMIDFALEAQRNQGKKPSDAIYEGCLIRFRPIMMTSMAALMGTLPIALGFGAGAEARRPLGLAVVGGLVFSQFITLYITPVIYVFLESFRERVKGWFRG